MSRQNRRRALTMSLSSREATPEPSSPDFDPVHPSPPPSQLHKMQASREREAAWFAAGCPDLNSVTSTTQCDPIIVDDSPQRREPSSVVKDSSGLAITKRESNSGEDLPAWWDRVYSRVQQRKRKTAPAPSQPAQANSRISKPLAPTARPPSAQKIDPLPPPPRHLRHVPDRQWPLVYWAVKHIDQRSYQDPERNEVTYDTGDFGLAWARACHACVKAGEPCLVAKGIRCSRCSKASSKCGAAGMWRREKTTDKYKQFALQYCLDLSAKSGYFTSPPWDDIDVAFLRRFPHDAILQKDQDALDLRRAREGVSSALPPRPRTPPLPMPLHATAEWIQQAKDSAEWHMGCAHYINAKANAAKDLRERELDMMERAQSRSGGVDEWRNADATAQSSKRKIVRGVEQAAKRVKDALTPRSESRDNRRERPESRDERRERLKREKEAEGKQAEGKDSYWRR
ncbi:hypothetical protein BDZ90DRAFT_182296 [Jaminaea rosea]|uniref:Uncharacterized protein n=1 Tax=Jaminaea rosea TaxID=1569628 RepID=A0A316UQI7_9BASI|nr:hypothetical protein BDZ90DRAFT_182296 [Jaminaea rosea]PWN27567.1 hypothetical protein BDZ90DRAFT_182296 [Jaminaea rosea]